MYDPVITQDELEAKDKRMEELETMVNNIKDRVLSHSNHEKMPNTTCFLILYYLGVLDRLAHVDRETKAAFVQPLVGSEGLTNLVRYCSIVSTRKLIKPEPPFTPTDFKRAYDHFEAAGLADICKRIEADWETLRKNITAQTGPIQ